MGMFTHHKTLEELQEEDENLSTQLSIEKKNATIRELKNKYGSGYVKAFSDNGKSSGLDFSRIINWLKTH